MHLRSENKFKASRGKKSKPFLILDLYRPSPHHYSVSCLLSTVQFVVLGETSRIFFELNDPGKIQVEAHFSAFQRVPSLFERQQLS